MVDHLDLLRLVRGRSLWFRVTEQIYKLNWKVLEKGRCRGVPQADDCVLDGTYAKDSSTTGAHRTDVAEWRCRHRAGWVWKRRRRIGLA